MPSSTSAAGTLPGLVQTGATFADAAAEFLRYVERPVDQALDPDRPTARSSRPTSCRPSAPCASRRSRPRRSSAGAGRSRRPTGSPLSDRTKNKLLVLLHGVFCRAQKVYGLPSNPVAGIERHPQRSSGDIQVFSVEEVYALARG